MRLRILGCSGGIGGRHLRTTSMLLDHDVLIDAGTGVMDLSIAELAAIDHVFLTHTHLDHVAALPLMVDTVGDMRGRPLTVHASEAALAILGQHLFNWSIWPDFREIPHPERPFLRFAPFEPGERRDLGQGRWISPLPAEHTVPAVGYLLESGQGSLAFSGDTGSCPAFWEAVNQRTDLRALIIECAFSNREEALARVSRHLCPNALVAELQQFAHGDHCDIYVTHLKPGQIELTMEEIETCLGNFRLRMLQNNQVIEL
ncbi:MBL fold metallo-hydrolase [Azovibrio restrictus]|uniref:MBL fold metallo-hydrolase n=1 Tax=Azovibrio restrictus TaxID=146938 RepID=UPI0003F984C3|nr:3',5'-cyclic-nucleotide phosphodiesterase [Azovibrio restrictus]MCE1170188.1 3',5'-cyclic-nucleotide phosphodiesterase [Azovibrio sp.]